MAISFAVGGVPEMIVDDEDTFDFLDHSVPELTPALDISSSMGGIPQLIRYEDVSLKLIRGAKLHEPTIDPKLIQGAIHHESTIDPKPIESEISYCAGPGNSRPEHGHPAYLVNPDAEGLYHCPWKAEADCSHEPEKVRALFLRNVDAHLRPYRCAHSDCSQPSAAGFSSIACLLRHEHEAHPMHGHGDKPHRCPHEGCERARPGDGFPRQWNLRDHMRRVHHDHTRLDGEMVKQVGPYALLGG